MNIEQSVIDEVLGLAKLNNTVQNITEKTSLNEKEVIKIFIESKAQTILSLKGKITKRLKLIEVEKTIEERAKLINKNGNSVINDTYGYGLNDYIQTMYENFQWVVDTFVTNGKEYYNNENIGIKVNPPSNTIIESLLKLVKKNSPLMKIQIALHLTPNEIIQHLIYIHKNKKTTISKRLTKIEKETKKNQRKLLRLDIEDIVNDMYSIYKWFVSEYENYCEMNETYRELNEIY